MRPPRLFLGLVLYMILPQPEAASLKEVGSFYANVSGEQPITAAATQATSVVASELAALQRVINTNIEIEIRTFHGLGSFAAVCTCGESPEFSLLVDPVMLTELTSLNDASLTFVVGHELGHFLQMDAQPELIDALCSNRVGSVRNFELIADFVGGYLTHKRYAGQESLNLLSVLSRLSDYAFSDVEHHGTVTERTSAYGMGSFAAAFEYPLNVETVLSKIDTIDEYLFVGPPRVSGASQLDVLKEQLERLYR